MDTESMMNAKKRSLLIVDDDELVRGLLEEVLSVDYNVECADSSDVALQKLRKSESRFDLALLDVNMPGMSGKKLLAVCHEEFPEMSVIIMTGAPEFDDAVDSVKQGAYDYIAKPIDMDELTRKVNTAINEKNEKKESGKFKECIGGDTQLDSKYKVVRSIGSGNSGVVLLVTKEDKPYAMKILREESNSNRQEQRLKRFIREAQILSEIEHPGVVKIFDFDLREESSVSFILMEYIDGHPLSKYIQSGELEMMKRLRIVMSIALALDYVHSFGVMHRDIKPDNILIDANKSPKLTDFGISRVSDSSLTMTDEIMGSPMYMAPECFDSSKAVSKKSDIFSLGVVAYEFLTGSLPFKGDNIYQVAQNVSKSLPLQPTKLNPEIPDWAENMMGRMLAKIPSKRFSSAGEIGEYIRTHLDGINTMTITSRILRVALHPKKEWS